MSSHRRTIPCVLAALVALAGRVAAEPSAAEIAAFLAKYRCQVAIRLVQIHATPDRADAQNRFLILSRADAPQEYVQCAFEDLDRTMFCEAASGAFFDEPRTMFLASSAIAALGRLGFSTDGSKENFKLRRDASNLVAIGDLMLTALAVGYDTTAAATVRFNAPDAPDDLGYCSEK